jgi:pimeloyl-ACP methyl ester carboxylesterase
MNKKVTFSLAAGVAGTAALSHALTCYLVKMAVDRQMPAAPAGLTRAAIRGSGCTQAFLHRLEKDGKALQAMPHRRLTIKARDGETLVGHFFTCPNPKRLILGMHGWRSSWCGDFGMIAPFLLQEGCCLLLPEQRGQGESGGAFMGLGALERHDCVRWANYLAGLYPHLPLYLAGVSMGAATVLMSTELSLPGTVRGLIGDCGFTSPQAICRHVVRNNLHLSYALRGPVAHKLCKQKNQAGLSGCSAPKALARCRLPVLLIHGSDDRFVPVEMTYENYKACSGPKHLLIVPGADHGMSYYKDPISYEQALKHFFCQYDKAVSPG